MVYTQVVEAIVTPRHTNTLPTRAVLIPQQPAVFSTRKSKPETRKKEERKNGNFKKITRRHE